MFIVTHLSEGTGVLKLLNWKDKDYLGFSNLGSAF